MGVSRKTLSKIINKQGRVTPEMAIRLSLKQSRKLVADGLRFVPRGGFALASRATADRASGYAVICDSGGGGMMCL